MNTKKVGEPCPKCSTLLIRRPRRIVARAGGSGDMAYCAMCRAAFEIDEPADIAAMGRPLTA